VTPPNKIEVIFNFFWYRDPEEDRLGL